MNDLETTKTINDKKQEILITEIYDDMRNILSKLPNKNSLYRDIKLDMTYLNLKHFIKGNDNLKPRSEKALLNRLGYKKVILYVNEDEISSEEISYLNALQNNFLKDLEDYTTKFPKEKKRFTKNDITKEDVTTVNNILNSYKTYDLNLDLQLDDLTIE